MSIVNTDILVNFADGAVETLLLTPEKRKEFFNSFAYYANVYSCVKTINGNRVYHMLPVELFIGQVINANAYLINLLGETPEFKGFRKLSHAVVGQEAAILLNNGHIVRGSIGKNLYTEDIDDGRIRFVNIFARCVDETGASVIKEIDGSEVVAVNTFIDLDVIRDLSIPLYQNTNSVLIPDMSRTNAEIKKQARREEMLRGTVSIRRR